MAKILVIDDEPMVREVLARLLSLLGHAVILANDGNQGIAIAKEKHPDLVFLDLSLPDLPGMEVLLRLTQWNPSIQVVICSGLGSDQVVNRLAQGQRLAFLQKPFSISDLKKCLETILGL